VHEATRLTLFAFHDGLEVLTIAVTALGHIKVRIPMLHAAAGFTIVNAFEAVYGQVMFVMRRRYCLADGRRCEGLRAEVDRAWAIKHSDVYVIRFPFSY
jgi:hypothetical protein